ncbi:S-methyl-5'-thioadenosine phosphorylase [Hydra vulgaris]|uniref:S-methyl-5'-thioadenosine phosphorylase n=1 Tax=Hydra vulgaris TaxID=6087 RepID=A0ABM4CWD6_HYDVU
MSKVKVGIIGGTGLDDPQLLLSKTEIDVDTPYGKPSSLLTVGELNGVPVVLISRHGKNHSIAPSQINYRANIWALKEIGCTHILATNACGSLKENYKIGDLIILDQFIDRTFKRENTFYSGLPNDLPGVQHIPMGEPFCEYTRNVLIEATKTCGFDMHERGNIVIIEGPRFSTRAESKMFQLWGGDLVGMTTVPEVCLAKEVGISYSSIAMVTDYDAWRDGDHVTVEQVAKVMHENAEKAKNVLLTAITLIGKQNWDEVIEKNNLCSRMAVM